MSVLRRLGRQQSVEGEYFLYRKPAKFISEILIVLSGIVCISSIGLLTSLWMELHRISTTEPDKIDHNHNRDYKFALLIYTVVILIVSVSDVIFSILLRYGTNKLRLSCCLFWRGATLTSLILVGLLTLAFITMIHDLIVVLGYLPSLISKPFALYIVNGFIHELAELRTFPGFMEHGAIPPARPSFSLDDEETRKRSTTVFTNMHKKLGRGRSKSYVVTSLKSIPEAE